MRKPLAPDDHDGSGISENGGEARDLVGIGAGTPRKVVNRS
jgi:hypothetical protein